MFNILKMNECIICYSKIKKTKQNSIIECKNGCNLYYHTDCFLKTGKNSCPLCRCEVKSNNKENINKIQYKYRLKYVMNELKYNNPIVSELKNTDLNEIMKYLTINLKDKN